MQQAAEMIRNPDLKETRSNPMNAIRIEKIVLNVGCGSDRDPEIAKYMLEKIAGKKAVITYAKTRTTWGIGRGKAIGAKVTVRKGADELLKRLLGAVDSRLKKSSFDNTGNVAFGIKEYMDMRGMEYDTKIGIMGFDICIRLERPGYRVKRKKLSRKVGRRHAIKPEEAGDFMKRKFGVEIAEEVAI